MAAILRLQAAFGRDVSLWQGNSLLTMCPNITRDFNPVAAGDPGAGAEPRLGLQLGLMTAEAVDWDGFMRLGGIGSSAFKAGSLRARYGMKF